MLRAIVVLFAGCVPKEFQSKFTHVTPFPSYASVPVHTLTLSSIAITNTTQRSCMFPGTTLAIGISTLLSRKLNRFMQGIYHLHLQTVNLVIWLHTHIFRLFSTINTCANLVIAYSNRRFQNQPFPIDLPVAPAEAPAGTEEPIVIEHKSLQELHGLDPYQFPVLSAPYSIDFLSRILSQ